MAGSFSSLNTALCGAALPAGRDGHRQHEHRQRRPPRATYAAGSSARRSAPATTPAMWSRSTEVGSGVRATGVDRMVDPFLDARGRARSTASSPTSTSQAEVLGRVETGLGEPGDTGVAAAFAELPRRAARPGQRPGQRRRPQPGARERPRTSPTRSTCRRATSPARPATSASKLLSHGRRGQRRRPGPGRDQQGSRRRPASPQNDAVHLLDGHPRPAGAAPRRAHRRQPRRSARTAASTSPLNGVALVTGADAARSSCRRRDRDRRRRRRTRHVPGRPGAAPRRRASAAQTGGIADLLDTHAAGLPGGTRRRRPSSSPTE